MTTEQMARAPSTQMGRATMTPIPAMNPPLHLGQMNIPRNTQPTPMMRTAMRNSMTSSMASNQPPVQNWTPIPTSTLIRTGSHPQPQRNDRASNTLRPLMQAGIRSAVDSPHSPQNFPQNASINNQMQRQMSTPAPLMMNPLRTMDQTPMHRPAATPRATTAKKMPAKRPPAQKGPKRHQTTHPAASVDTPASYTTSGTPRDSVSPNQAMSTTPELPEATRNRGANKRPVKTPARYSS